MFQLDVFLALNKLKMLQIGQRISSNFFQKKTGQNQGAMIMR